MPVDTQHPEYKNMVEEWALVKACSSGAKQVKELKTKILPAPGAKNNAYDETRYKSYLTRAIYTNVTGRTKQGLTGAAFRKPVVVDLPAELEYLNVDADGAGQSITQLAKDVFASLLDTGREILVVDYPTVESGLTAEQVKALNLTAYVKNYGALEFINWKSEAIAGKSLMSKGVLVESYNDESDDEFAHNIKFQHRVQRLNEGVYTQQVYRDNEHVTEEMAPRDASGSYFEFIPTFVIGSQNNDLTVDPIPLSDIAHVNVGHFRNSADLEENCFIHGQLTLGISSEMSNDEFTTANPSGVTVGSNSGHFLGKGGSFNSVQADANQLADKLMERKEEQMLALGARLVESRNAAETATAARIDATGENSVLSDLVDNVEEGFQRCIEWCGLFMGVEVDGKEAFKMNREFFDASLTPDELRAVVELWQGGAISKSVLDGKLVKADVIPGDTDLEEMNTIISEELPGVDLDVDENV